MGYIAPIRMTQYSEYQKRVQEKSKTRDPMPVKFSPRIKLQPKLESGTHQEGTTFKFKEKKQHDSQEATYLDENLPLQTGKGQYINEYV